MEPDLTTLLGSLQSYLDLPVERIRTMEPGHYTSQAFFDREVETIWKKQWINVGHVSEIRNPGDFFTVELIGEPLMIVRGQDMEIRALSTVCRHRYMLVVKPGESGNASQFQCPYHHWTYQLDGKLTLPLHMDRHQDFDLSKICLPQFRLEIWNDLIWVNLDDDAEPTNEDLNGEWFDFLMKYELIWVGTADYVAEKIANRIQNRQSKNYLPRDEEGRLEHLPSVDALPMEKGEWLILASCDYMLNGDKEGYNIRKKLINQGAPFSHNSFRYIPFSMVQAIEGWKKLNKKRTNITVGELETVYRYLTKNEVKRGFLSAPGKEENKENNLTKKQIVSLFGLKEDCLGLPWEEVFTKKIKEEKRAFIKKALNNNEDLKVEPRIALSTIHKAKGGEADNVAVLLDLSPAQKLNAMLNADSLHRQFYVAVTRTKENLFLINAQNESLKYGL